METNVITKWAVDRAHSEVLFKAKHLVISTVSGQFKDFNAGLEMEEGNMEDARAWFTANVESISTNNTDRDNHLKSPDFFDSGNYPEIRFESLEFVHVGGNSYKLTGNLSMRGITKTITLDVEFGGTMTDPYGNKKAGYEITGKINRSDFGLKWNAVTEAGGLVVGDEIKLALNIQMIMSEG